MGETKKKREREKIIEEKGAGSGGNNQEGGNTDIRGCVSWLAQYIIYYLMGCLQRGSIYYSISEQEGLFFSVFPLSSSVCLWSTVL